jgi:hypothetical protein
MKTLQRQNTKRETVKRVRFQKNDVAIKGVSATMQQEEFQEHHLQNNKINIENTVNLHSQLVPAPAPPAPAPANSESLESNIVIKRDEEEDDNKKCDAITLSLNESGIS